jgi:Protein of unknown function (DUF3237)
MDLNNPPFPPVEPKLEFAFEVRLQFDRQPTIKNISRGGERGYVGVISGTFEGPGIKGTAVPNSGGDWAHFRTDGVTEFDAMYLLETDDGHRILLRNAGYSWFRSKQVEENWDRIKDGHVPGVTAVSPDGYYFRTHPTFEVASGSKYDWLNRTVFVGTGARALNGNVIRYFKVV